LNTSPAEPLWLSLEDVLEIQIDQIARFGGANGVREKGLIESAVARSQQLFKYGSESDILTLAVRLGVGIAQNHGFVDGNKRTGAVAMLEFLIINGYYLNMADDTTLGALFEAAATGTMSEEELAEALFAHIQTL